MSYLWRLPTNSKSYNDYLQNMEYVNDVRYEISSQTRELVASNEQINDGLLEGIENLSGTVSEGFDQLSGKLGDIEDAVYSLNATFQWGFSNVLLSLGRLNDTITDLKTLMENPAKAWAYEQYFDARKAFLNGWHKESYELIQHAINGHGSNTGYKLEFRFHFLLGENLLGNGKNHEKDIVDPTAAERSFLDAARYSEKQFPQEAALAYLCASRSAYVQGKAKEALEHVQKARRLDARLLEAQFEASKVLCHLKRWPEANPVLKELFEIKPMYAIKALDDNDINTYTDNLTQTISDVTKSLQSEVDKLKNDLAEYLAVYTTAQAKLGVLKLPELHAVKDRIKEAEAEKFPDTLVGARTTRDRYREIIVLYKRVAEQQINILLTEGVKTHDDAVEKELIYASKEFSSAQYEHSEERDSFSGRYSKRGFKNGFFGMMALCILLIIAINVEANFTLNLFDILVYITQAVIMSLTIGAIASVTGLLLGFVRKIFSPRKSSYVRAKERSLKDLEKRKVQGKAMLESDIGILRELLSNFAVVQDIHKGIDSEVPTIRGIKIQ